MTDGMQLDLGEVLAKLGGALEQRAKGLELMNMVEEGLREQMNDDKPLIDSKSVEVFKFLQQDPSLRVTCVLGIGMTLVVNAFDQIMDIEPDGDGQPRLKDVTDLNLHAAIAQAILAIQESTMRVQFENRHPEVKEDDDDDASDRSADDPDEQGMGEGDAALVDRVVRETSSAEAGDSASSTDG